MKNAPFSHAAWYMPSLVLLMQLATCLLVSFSGSMGDRLTAADGKHRRRALMTLVHVSFLIKRPFTQSFMPTWTLTQVTFLDCWTRLDRLESKLVTVKPGDMTTCAWSRSEQPIFSACRPSRTESPVYSSVVSGEIVRHWSLLLRWWCSSLLLLLVLLLVGCCDPVFGVSCQTLSTAWGLDVALVVDVWGATCLGWQLLHCFLSLFNFNFASISCIVDFMLFMITFRELISILKCSRSAFCEAFTAASSARNCSVVQFISCSLRSSSDGDKVGVFSCSLCTLSEGDSKVGVVSFYPRTSTEGDRLGVVSSFSRAL